MFCFRNIGLIVLFVFVGYGSVSASEKSTEKVVIEWNSLYEDYETGAFLTFNGSIAEGYTGLPMYSKIYSIPEGNCLRNVQVVNTVFEYCIPPEIDLLRKYETIGNELDVNFETSFVRKKPFVSINFVPLRISPVSGLPEKLVSFDLIIELSESVDFVNGNSRSYVENSVLGSGNWYKISLENSGIHKITYDDFVSFGIDPANIDPQTIQLFGNGGQMLPEANSLPRIDDLIENSIIVYGGEDGKFDPDDYILFFGESPHKWDYIPLGYFSYSVNYYSDKTCYFLTYNQEPGKRIQIRPVPAGTISHVVTKYNNYDIFEDEKFSILESGKIWYAENFSDQTVYDYDFNFPGLDLDSDIIVKLNFAGRSGIATYFRTTINGTRIDSATITPVDLASTTYARTKKRTLIYEDPSSEHLNIKVEYLRSEMSAEGWLNYISINVIQDLIFRNGEIMFRDVNSVALNHNAEFVIENANYNAKVWDITDPLNPAIIETQINGTQLSFVAPTDSLCEYVAFDGSGIHNIHFEGIVQNQNLHAVGPHELVIITHPDFLPQAEEVAEIHRQNDDMTVFITEPGLIYNEFSSGSQDVTAIRDFMKMLYDKYGELSPRYLLLFGDGSFDMKDRIENNTNFIPTYQTKESWNTANSYVVDDYFGLLDDTEGNEASGMLDIGIGRIPAKTTEDADIAVKKIRQYINTSETMGPWRTRICIIGDDEDGNLHFEQADSLARELERTYKQYDIKKIFLDAYPQIQTPAGKRYPDVNFELNEQVNNGSLLVNYIGHGGERGWAHERILEIPDIKKWENLEKLSVFLTATCEFTRFDDPHIVSGGEQVYLNPNGGGVALFTTTRLAYSSSNFSLTKLFYQRVFELLEDDYPRLGDLIMLSKPQGSLTTRNFMLVGDPALRLLYPEYKVRTVEINGEPVGGISDTIRALQMVTVKGAVTDTAGNIISDFNGVVHPIIYDKSVVYSTRANNPSSTRVDFLAKDKVINKGKVSVTNGEFEYTFIVPKDLTPLYGKPKISYYAHSENLNSDASGYYDDFIAGGIDNNAQQDLTGPEIQLYLEDELFVSGGLTDKNPIMYASLSDESGINFYGTSIGHDIVATLDNEKIILNDYFEPELDSYQTGSVVYPFSDLPDGTHTLTLKAWDVYNNSSESTITFIIDSKAKLDLYQVYTYPNPMTDITYFTFDHNRPGDNFEINLEVYEITGKKVYSDQMDYSHQGLQNAVFEWDGTDLNGAILKNGLYIYRLIVKDQNDFITERRNKLLIAR
ncbi:MAG: type IX secretion system sortase PorU [Bacteroidales bacterium]|nr:type IX secretion system sortase PorU [Bacteroidales bacterium]